MDLLLRHFWITFVVVTFVNGRVWWREAQSQIERDPSLEPGYRRLYRGYLFWMNVPWVAMGLGILSGRVGYVHEFLRPADRNPAVLTWWSLMAGLFALGTCWMFVGGGAELLERHPGMPMVPRWSAAKLRVFWVGVIAWNASLGFLLLQGFPERHPEPSEWMPALFPVFFVGMWVGVCSLLSEMGGWRTLARHYGASSPFPGKRFRFRSARLGGVNYNSCLTFEAGPAGLHISVLAPFRVGHPPLLVPWSDITAREEKSWLSAFVVLAFARAPGTQLRLSVGLARALLDAGGATAIVVQPAR